MKQASAVAAKTVSILATKVQTIDLRKAFFGTFDTAFGTLYSEGPPMPGRGASPVDSVIRGREGLIVISLP